MSPRDERRRFISGFSGSAGWAAVTSLEAALWTDSRYFLQADQQLDCKWKLMRDREPGVRTTMARPACQLIKALDKNIYLFYPTLKPTISFMNLFWLQVPSMEQWLSEQLGPGAVVSADTRTVPQTQWLEWATHFGTFIPRLF